MKIMRIFLSLLVCLSVLGCADQQKLACVHTRWQATFMEADGEVGPFANMKYTLIRASDNAVVYQGTTDGKGHAQWDGACEGEAYTIRQDGLLGD